MNDEFNEIEDAMFDLMIDHLHQFAEAADEGDELAAVWVSGSADRATAF